MANLFWVGGAGNWDQATQTHWSLVSGGIGGAPVPTAADDVFLDANSGAVNVTVTANAPCRSLNCTGFTGTLTHNGAVTISIGDGTAGASNSALKLVAGMTYTKGNGITSAFAFVSTSATQQSITWAGKAPGNVTFNGAGGKWQFADGYTATTTTLTLTAGTLDVNGKTLSLNTFSSSNANTRTLTLGAASITVSAITGWITTTTTNLTVTANTATVTMTGAGAVFSAGSINYNGLSLVQNGSGVTSITTAPTLANYTRTGTATKSDGVQIGATVTITGVLTLTGSSATDRLYVNSTTEGTAVTFALGATGTSSPTNVDFRDIDVTGTNTPISGTSVGNALHNSGITFTTPTTQTHDGTTSNWSTAARWTSRVPLPQDTVLVPSGSGTITVDMPRMGAGVSFAGFTGTASFSSLPTTLYGSITLGAGMTVSGTQTLVLAARSSETITSNGKAFTMLVAISPSGGTYTLADNMSAPSVSVSAGTTDLSTFTLTLSGTGTVLTRVSGASLAASSGTIAVTDTSASSKTLGVIQGVTIGTLTITAGGAGVVQVGTAVGTHTIGTLNLTGGSKNLRFFAGATYAVTTWNVSGTAGNLVTIDTTTAGSAATLSKTGGGVVSTSYLSLKDSAATGGSWYAGATSTNVSGNTGWTFTAPPSAGSFLPFFRQLQSA